MGKNKTTKYDKMFINKIPLDQCVACGCKLRWCQVRVAFDENGKSIAHCQPVHICDNYRCPESPNFRKYLLGEYEPPTKWVHGKLNEWPIDPRRKSGDLNGN